MLGCAAGGPLRAQATDSGRVTRPPRAFCFRGQPRSACRRYVVFEVTGAARVAGTDHTSGTCFPGSLCRQRDLGGYLARDVGAMANVDSTHAFGASAQIGGADPGGVRLALKARGRVWLPHRLTLDAAAGPLMAQQDFADNQGVHETYGATADAALGVADLASVMVGADVVNGPGHQTRAMYVGARLGAHAGVAGSVVIAALAIGVLVALSHGLD
ncbi:MAG TPA: hypothetical protein VHB25_20285 [Gemmatimonadaceae bacterium]|nr:hypothetical protein [Gemmatimonadaceae bacterium]